MEISIRLTFPITADSADAARVLREVLDTVEGTAPKGTFWSYAIEAGPHDLLREVVSVFTSPLPSSPERR